MAIFNTIKLKLDCKKQYEKAIDSLTSKQVAFWLNNNLKFKLSFFDNGATFELSSAKKIYLGIKAMNGFGEISDSFDILKEIDVSTTSSNSIDIEISSSDISMKMTAGLKWLVVYAEDSIGGFLTFFGGKIICQNDASDGVASGESINRIEKYIEQNIGKISEALEDAKAKIDTWSDQTERFAQNEANISALFSSKANNGALHFYGGNVQCSKLGLQPFSFAVRIKANKNDVLIKKQVNIIDMGVFYLYIHSSVQLLSVYATGTGNSLKSVTTAQNDRIFDGNWHSLFVTYDGTTLTLSDEYGVLLTVNYSIQEQTSDTKFGSNFVGQMQDVCIFNFDMLADDAPYTIEDYQNGRAIPPNLLNVVLFGSGKNPKVIASDSSHSWDNNNYILTQNYVSQTVKSIRYDFIISKGETVNFSFNDLVDGVLIDGIYGKFELLNKSLATVKTISLTGITLNEKYITSEDIVQIRFTFNCNTATSTENLVPTILENFNIYKDGTILALEDYTFNGKVLDYSGNKNHATVTGNVIGDNDTRVSAFVEAITTATSEQN